MHITRATHMRTVRVSCIAALILSGSCQLGPAADTAKSPAPFTPQNPPEMKPITNRNSPAHRAAMLFVRGANLGNYLEVPPGQNWGVTVSADELAIMRA